MGQVRFTNQKMDLIGPTHHTPNLVRQVADPKDLADLIVHN
jgi:hypothetical protein